MSASRNGYIGRAPADSSVIIARKTYEPTGVQTDFTFSAGYTPGYCDVYLNGIKLIDSTDYTATGGSVVGLTSAANSGDILEIVAYKAFNLGIPVSNITGNLDVTGNISASSSITAGAGVYVTGVVTATSFYGDGSNLSGVAGAAITQYVSANSLTVLGSPGVSTITRLGATDLNVTGIITANGLSGNVTGSACTFTTGTFNGNVTIGGTLTYEDVTNVDSLGIVTARAGVNISGGELLVGSNIKGGTAGVLTATSFSGSGANLTSLPTQTPTTITVADESSDTTCFPSFFTAATGDLAPKTGTNLTFNSSTGALTATSFVGDGSNLSNITSTTINSNANNRLITGSGTANTLNGESTLTYDGTTLALTGAQTISNGETISGGEFKVGSGITMSATAGVTTYSNVGGGISFRDNIKFYMGNEGDLEIYNANANSYIKHKNGSGDLMIQGADKVRIGSLTQDVLKLNGSDYSLAAYSNSGSIAFIVNDGGAFDAGVEWRAGITTFTSSTKIIDIDAAEIRIGTGVTIASTTGIATFSKDVYFMGGTTGRNATWDASENSLEFADSALAKFGTGQDFHVYHDGSNAVMDNSTGDLHIKTTGSGDDVILTRIGSEKFRTTYDGVSITGIATVTQGLNTDGLLSEKFNTTAGKLSDNTNIDLEDGMVHYFSTTESTTSTPNIRYNSSKSLNNMLSTGDAITVTIITTAAAAGYSANVNIDGSGQTEEWVGGSAPSEGGGSGHDIYTYNILKTGSTAYKVIVNVLNATN